MSTNKMELTNDRLGSLGDLKSLRNVDEVVKAATAAAACSPLKSGGVTGLKGTGLSHSDRRSIPTAIPVSLKRTISKSWKKTVQVLFLYVLAIMTHTALGKVVYYRGVVHLNMVGTPPLYDLGFEALPDTRVYRWIPEVLYVVPAIYFVYKSVETLNIVAIRSFMACHAILLLLRAASFSLTILPDASQRCQTSPYIGGCHDLVFSGHTCFMLICIFLNWHHYNPPKWMKVYFVASAVVTLIMIVSSRNHYSVDVVVATYTAGLVFSLVSFHPFFMAWVRCEDLGLPPLPHIAGRALSSGSDNSSTDSDSDDADIKIWIRRRSHSSIVRAQARRRRRKARARARTGSTSRSIPASPGTFPEESESFREVPHIDATLPKPYSLDEATPDVKDKDA